jgi:hypothetical protein
MCIIDPMAYLLLCPAMLVVSSAPINSYVLKTKTTGFDRAFADTSGEMTKSSPKTRVWLSEKITNMFPQPWHQGAVDADKGDGKNWNMEIKRR